MSVSTWQYPFYDCSISSLLCIYWTVGFDKHKIALPTYGRSQLIYFINVKYGIKRCLDHYMYMCYIRLEVSTEVTITLWSSALWHTVLLMAATSGRNICRWRQSVVADLEQRPAKLQGIVIRGYNTRARYDCLIVRLAWRWKYHDIWYSVGW